VKVPFLRQRNVTFLLLFSVVLTVPPVVRANRSAQPRGASGTEQDDDIDLLASRMVEKLKISNIKTVAIRPFHSSKPGDRGLGYKLSDSFTLALAKATSDIHIVDRTGLLQALRERKWMAIDLDQQEGFRTVAVALGADAVISGKFRVGGKFLELSLEAVNLSTEKNVAELKADIRVPQGIDRSLDVPVRDPVTGVYVAGVGGVTAPTCNYCPQPEYSPEARRKQIRKVTDTFLITVRADGRVADIRLLKPAGHGLDENSIAVLQRWELSPARLADRTAVPSRVNVEVKYSLR
jgi:TonB family protein